MPHRVQDSGPAPPAGRVARRGCLRRLIRGAVAAVVVLLGAGLVAHLVWQRRLRLVNEWLASMQLPVQVRVGALDWQRGGIRLAAVTLLDKAGRNVGGADIVDVAVSTRTVSERVLEAVTISGLRWTATPEQWAAMFPATGPEQDATNAAPDSAGEPWRLEQVTLRQATVELAPRAGARLEAALDWQGEAVAWEPGVGLRVAPQQVTFSRLAMTAPDGGRAFAENATLTWSLDPATRTLDLSAIEWPGGELGLSPALPAFFAREKSAEPQPARIAIENAAPEPGPPAPDVSTPWTTRLGSVRLGQPGRPLQTSWRFPGQPAVTAAVILEGQDFVWDGDWAVAALTAELASVKIQASMEGPAVSSTITATLPHLAFALRRERAGPVVLDRAQVTEGRLAWSAMPPEERAGEVRVETTFSLAATELTARSDGGWTSPHAQRLEIGRTRLTYPDDTPCLGWESLALELIPEEVRTTGRIASLTWNKPELTVEGAPWRELVAALTSRDPSPPATFPEAAPASPSSPTPPWWQRLHAGHLAVTDGTLAVSQMGPGWPDARARWTVGTSEDGLHRFALEDVALTTPGSPLEPVARVQEITALVRSDRLAHRELESLTLTGADVRAGAALQEMMAAAAISEVNAEGPTAETPPPPATPGDAPEIIDPPSSFINAPLPGWTVKTFDLASSRIEIADVLPLLDPIAFDLAFTLRDVPLTPEGLARQTQRQRIELAGLKLHSAYGGTGSLPVVEFGNIFLDFTLAGLLQRRVERVEVVSPVIYVGEQLFWYIDYFRGHTARAAAATATAEAPPATTTDPPAVPEPKWSVGEVNAHFGKMRLALRGSVIDTLPALPFSCTTRLDEGQVDLTLDIPRDTYKPASGLPLEIDVLEGVASFNYPLKEKDNNLVQVFRASELRYKQVKAQDVFLTVTFDQHGVYARFGGKLYGGYLSGGGDLYLQDDISWDGWLDGRDINLEPLTHALTPEYFTLSGTSRFNIMSYGDLTSLDIATGRLEATTPGHLTVLALDPLKEKLPDAWRQLQRSLTENSLEAFRDFPYDQGGVTLKLYHQEGDLDLRFSGPRGLRAFQVKLHDHRNRKAP